MPLPTKNNQNPIPPRRPNPPRPNQANNRKPRVDKDGNLLSKKSGDHAKKVKEAKRRAAAQERKTNKKAFKTIIAVILVLFVGVGIFFIAHKLFQKEDERHVLVTQPRETTQEREVVKGYEISKGDEEQETEDTETQETPAPKEEIKETQKDKKPSSEEGEEAGGMYQYHMPGLYQTWTIDEIKEMEEEGEAVNGFFPSVRNPFQLEVKGPEYPVDVDLPAPVFPASRNLGYTGIFLGEASKMTPTKIEEEFKFYNEEYAIDLIIGNIVPSAEDGFTSDPSQVQDGEMPNPYYTLVTQEDLEAFILYEISRRTDPNVEEDYEKSIYPGEPLLPGQLMWLRVDNLSPGEGVGYFRVDYRVIFRGVKPVIKEDYFNIYATREEGLQCKDE